MAQCETNLSLNPAVFGRGERGFAAWLSEAGTTLLGRFLAWRERARSRKQLGKLNGRLLRDIGLDRATAQVEADKSFWQA